MKKLFCLLLLVLLLSPFLFASDTVCLDTLEELRANLNEAKILLQSWSLSLNSQESDWIEKQKLLSTLEQSLNEKERALTEREMNLIERESFLMQIESDLMTTKSLIADLQNSLTKASDSLKRAKTVNKVLSISLGVSIISLVFSLIK